MVDDAPQFHRQLDDLIDNRFRVVAGEGGGASAAAFRLVIDDFILIGRQKRRPQADRSTGC